MEMTRGIHHGNHSVLKSILAAHAALIRLTIVLVEGRFGRRSDDFVNWEVHVVGLSWQRVS